MKGSLVADLVARPRLNCAGAETAATIVLKSPSEDENNQRSEGLGTVARRLVVRVLFVLLLLELAFSLRWPIVHDIPLLHYVAFLMDQHGYIPYRDVFETSMLGTFWFHFAIVKLFGYGDLAFRAVDIFYLVALLALAWSLLRRIHPSAAWACAGLFGLLYLRMGSEMSLQKDYVGILPVALALLVAADGPRPIGRRAISVGALFGIAALMKPHLGIGLPVIFIYLMWEHLHSVERPLRAISTTIRCAALVGCGLLVTWTAPFIWLWWNGGLPAFIELYTQYLPLHLQLTGEHGTISGAARWMYLVKSTLGTTAGWLLGAALGIFVVLYKTHLDRRQKTLVITLGALTLVYSVYAALAGQFWPYHQMPFRFFAVASMSLLVMLRTPLVRGRVAALLPIVVFAGTVVFALPASSVFGILFESPQPASSQDRAQEIARFLKAAELGPDDTVQPLDWISGGVVHGMLLAKARIASRFMHDYHFYHHVSEPFIQELRRRLLEDLNNHPPRFVVDWQTVMVSGEDTADEFPA